MRGSNASLNARDVTSHVLCNCLLSYLMFLQLKAWHVRATVGLQASGRGHPVILIYDKHPVRRRLTIMITLTHGTHMKLCLLHAQRRLCWRLVA